MSFRVPARCLLGCVRFLCGKRRGVGAEGGGGCGRRSFVMERETERVVLRCFRGAAVRCRIIDGNWISDCVCHPGAKKSISGSIYSRPLYILGVNTATSTRLLLLFFFFVIPPFI